MSFDDDINDIELVSGSLVNSKESHQKSDAIYFQDADYSQTTLETNQLVISTQPEMKVYREKRKDGLQDISMIGGCAEHISVRAWERAVRSSEIKMKKTRR